MTRLRVVVLTQGGLGVPICRRLAEVPEVDLVCGVFESPLPKRRGLVERVRRGIRYNGILATVANLSRRAAGQRPRWQSANLSGDLNAIRQTVPRTIVATDIHAPDVLAELARADLDLGVVVGTTILKPALFNIPGLGMVNLHQGQVPQYRGSAVGFWTLWDGATEYGLTVHRVVAGVDAGDVLATRSVPMSYDYAKYGPDFERFLSEYMTDLTQPSVDLVVDAVRSVATGTAVWTPQDPALGQRRRIPTYKQKRQLARTLHERYRRGI